jgi:hypothetical protein
MPVRIHSLTSSCFWAQGLGFALAYSLEDARWYCVSKTSDPSSPCYIPQMIADTITARTRSTYRIVIGSFWQYNVSRDTAFMYVASYAAGTLGCLFWTSWVSAQEEVGTAQFTYKADILVHHNVGVPSGRSALREGQRKPCRRHGAW